MSEVRFSKYQLDIFDVYQNTNKNICVEACPGSGKSFTILELLNRTPKFKKVILTAFNKSIAEELKDKVSENVKVSTIHSLGYSILRDNKPRRYKVTSYKTFMIAKSTLNLSNMKEKERNIYLYVLSKIIDLTRLNLAKTGDQILSLCESYNISTMNGEIDDVLKLMKELDRYNSKDHKEFMIDFVDMLWLPYKQVDKNLFPKYNVVFTDELQDLNPLQKYIIDNIVKEKTGRFVGVGDSKQSIYSFMGSNLDSFNSFKNRENTVCLPLSVTYRCSKNIVEFANSIFEGVEPFEENEEGVVRIGKLEEVREGDFVLCRNNLPLIESWIKFVKQGKKCSILGKDYGEQLLTIVNKLKRYDDYNEGVKLILDKKEEELKKMGVNNPKNTSVYNSLLEKLNIINILKKEFGSIEVTFDKIEEIFTDSDSDGIKLMTIHKSKGLENERVFILGYEELLPSKYAVTINELYQEQCLKYVAVTRAKKELVFVNL